MNLLSEDLHFLRSHSLDVPNHCLLVNIRGDLFSHLLLHLLRLFLFDLVNKLELSLLLPTRLTQFRLGLLFLLLLDGKFFLDCGFQAGLGFELGVGQLSIG
jgi:hypothetical protein